MALHAQVQVLSELHMVKDELFAIPEVERVFVSSGPPNVFDVMVIIPDNNSDVLDKIISVESDIIKAFPWLEVDFDIIVRSGRAWNEIVSPDGSLLFAR
jgi:hypothetical protein